MTELEVQAVPLLGLAAVLTGTPPGPVYSFLPAGGAHDSGGLPGKLTEALRAYLSSEGDARAVLLADFQKDSRVDPRPFTITFADLSHANPGQEWLTVNQSEAVFVVTATDPVSMDDAREKAAWLRAVKSEGCCGLILLPADGGATAREAEDITGLPVCAVIHRESQIAQLARWIAQD